MNARNDSVDDIPARPLSSPWRAKLTLEFTSATARTQISRREHEGPLRVLKPLYPEGESCCHAVVVHPPGGVVGGDRLQLNVSAGESSHAVVTTPGAQKWYRSIAGESQSCTELRVEQNARLEWLPQETIVFDGAQAHQALKISLHKDAHFVGWEIVCFGRTASNEKFTLGRFRQTIEISRDDRLLWLERSLIDGSDPLLQSGLGWGGFAVGATAWIVLPNPGTDLTGDENSNSVLARVREMIAGESHAAASMPKNGFIVIKVVGVSTESVRELLIRVWCEVRLSVTGIDAQLPRIWST